jgi:hypothetical protein
MKHSTFGEVSLTRKKLSEFDKTLPGNHLDRFSPSPEAGLLPKWNKELDCSEIAQPCPGISLATVAEWAKCDK